MRAILLITVGAVIGIAGTGLVLVPCHRRQTRELYRTSRRLRQDKTVLRILSPDPDADRAFAPSGGAQ